MDYKEALKTVQAKKTRENFMLISFGYSLKLILPYKDGLAFMESVSNGEMLSEPYNEAPRIKGIERNVITVDHLSRDTYERYKIAELLGITVDEVKEYGLKVE